MGGFQTASYDTVNAYSSRFYIIELALWCQECFGLEILHYIRSLKRSPLKVLISVMCGA